jgi:hypothetical protein
MGMTCNAHWRAGNVYRILIRKHERKNDSIGINRRILLKRIFKEMGRENLC